MGKYSDVGARFTEAGPLLYDPYQQTTPDYKCERDFTPVVFENNALIASSPWRLQNPNDRRYGVPIPYGHRHTEQLVDLP
jgi:hypothetical protein